MQNLVVTTALTALLNYIQTQLWASNSTQDSPKTVLKLAHSPFPNY
jgi:hypothetical protein